MKALLVQLAMVFQTREPEAFYYEDRMWKTAFVGGNYEWLRDGGLAGRFLDAHSLFFYFATVNTPAMAIKIVGVAQKYAYTSKDKDGNYLDGGKNYRLNLPANIPARNFWSVCIYDPQTRSELQTSQPYPAKNSQRDPLHYNADGSIDLFFGPDSPEGMENNWIQTVPGKGWFTVLRLYGPLESWFDKTWRPSDFEPIKQS